MIIAFHGHSVPASGGTSDRCLRGLLARVPVWLTLGSDVQIGMWLRPTMFPRDRVRRIDAELTAACNSTNAQNPAQRQVLYRQAEGLSRHCGHELDLGWHADHRVPWADGGRTTVENGQALCAACNLAKGRDMAFRDEFRPRPFELEVAVQVLDGIAAP
ncbi:HNH endonuclease [Streptacidiphilus sp. MAP12-20]|uniref:HNH endonuclease n=1 Tax=Streptacidiphilus sp. MAP12-20 TaxID=3156299 RepID=UPI003519D484